MFVIAKKDLYRKGRNNSRYIDFSETINPFIAHRIDLSKGILTKYAAIKAYYFQGEIHKATKN